MVFYVGAFVHALYAVSAESLGTITMQLFHLGVRGEVEMHADIFGLDGDSEFRSLQTFWFVAATLLITAALMNIFIAIVSSAYSTKEKSCRAAFVRSRATVSLNYAMRWEGLSIFSVCACRRNSLGHSSVASETKQVWLCQARVFRGRRRQARRGTSLMQFERQALLDTPSDSNDMSRQASSASECQGLSKF